MLSKAEQVERACEWLFNGCYDHFGTTKEAASQVLGDWDLKIPHLWRERPAYEFEPLYPQQSKPYELIGISGLAGSGKDTCADHLCSQYGFGRDSFARPIKLFCKAAFGWSERHVNGDLKEVVDPAWQISPRRAMQLLGTECVRDTIHPDFWIKSMELRLSGPTVISDVRYPNEVEFVLRLGKVWRLQRQDRRACADPTHPSETALLDWKQWSAEIDNNGTIAELWAKVDKLMEK